MYKWNSGVGCKMWFSPDSRHITVGLTYCTSNTQDTFYPLPAPAMPVYETFFLYNREILIVWHTCMLNILHTLPKMREVYKIRLTQNSVLLKQQLCLETCTHLYLSVSACFIAQSAQQPYNACQCMLSSSFSTRLQNWNINLDAHIYGQNFP